MVLVARREELLREAVAELEEGAALACPADVGDEASAAVAFEAAIGRFGQVDFLCNNAGADGQGRDFAELDEGAYRQLTEVNVGGAFRFSQALARHLRARRAPGAIVNVASINGILAERHFSDYNTSKGALIALTRSIAIDLAPEVRANVICPGYVETEMTAHYLADPDARRRIEDDIPLGRVGLPHEIGETIAFLFSDHASYITGAAIMVDGGRTAGWRGGL